MQTILQSIQFLRSIQKGCNLIDPDNFLEGAIEHLELLQRRFLQDKQGYLLEISLDEFTAYLKFKEAWKLQELDRNRKLITT